MQEIEYEQEAAVQINKASNYKKFCDVKFEVSPEQLNEFLTRSIFTGKYCLSSINAVNKTSIIDQDTVNILQNCMDLAVKVFNPQVACTVMSHEFEMPAMEATVVHTKLELQEIETPTTIAAVISSIETESKIFPATPEEILPTTNIPIATTNTSNTDQIDTNLLKKDYIEQFSKAAQESIVSDQLPILTEPHTSTVLEIAGQSSEIEQLDL